MRPRHYACGILAFSLLAPAALASTLDLFTLSLYDGSERISFELPSSPTVLTQVPALNAFRISNILVTTTDSPPLGAVVALDDLQFYTAANLGGLTFFEAGTNHTLRDFQSDTFECCQIQLFSGLISAPLFSPLRVTVFPNRLGPFYYLTIDPVPDAEVPEPATLTLLLSGVAGLGAILHKTSGRR